MDLRDSIAIEAMKVIIMSYHDEALYIGDDGNASQIALLSYEMADAMIEARDVKNALDKNFPDIQELDLSFYTSNILKKYNIDSVGKLITYRELDLLKLPSCGRKSINEIKEALKRFNLNLVY